MNGHRPVTAHDEQDVHAVHERSHEPPESIDLRDPADTGLSLAHDLLATVRRERATAQALREYLQAASTPHPADGS